MTVRSTNSATAVLLASAIALLTSVTTAANATTANATTIPCRWKVVDTPGSDGQLQGVSGTSSTDVWAVGHAGFDVPPIILHWDGTAWTAAPQQPVDAWLLNVAAVAPADAWAVGYRPTEGGDHPLAMHWDGTVWRVVPVPDFPLGGRLLDVSALSSTDVWAVGYYETIEDIPPLTIHWDGTSWTQVPASDAGSNNPAQRRRHGCLRRRVGRGNSTGRPHLQARHRALERDQMELRSLSGGASRSAALRGVRDFCP